MARENMTPNRTPIKFVKCFIKTSYLAKLAWPTFTDTGSIHRNNEFPVIASVVAKCLKILLVMSPVISFIQQVPAWFPLSGFVE